jgi:hypothetical protein
LQIKFNLSAQQPIIPPINAINQALNKDLNNRANQILTSRPPLAKPSEIKNKCKQQQQQQTQIINDNNKQVLKSQTSSILLLNENEKEREENNASPNSQLYRKLLKMISDSSDLNLNNEMNTLLQNPLIKSRLKQLHEQLLKNPTHFVAKFECLIKNDHLKQTKTTTHYEDLMDLKKMCSNMKTNDEIVIKNTSTMANIQNVQSVNATAASLATSFTVKSISNMNQLNSLTSSNKNRLFDKEFKRR